MAELDSLMNITLVCECELGETYITVGNFLKLEAGSIIKLNTVSGGNVKMVISGRKLLTGEIGANNNKFSVKIVDIAKNNEN